MALLTERYSKQIRGVISCFDRIVMIGTLVGPCYAEGMTSFLRARGIRIFDYSDFVAPMRDEIRDKAQHIADEYGLEIEFIRNRNAFRKEDRIKEILQSRGHHPGLVHIFSAMESCPAFIAWTNKKTGSTSLRHKDGKCLHYYFYFILKDFGLCFMRVPTWAPFRLQFYCNGHNWLANQLSQRGVTFKMLDNVFLDISEFESAQALADDFPVKQLHRELDRLASYFCPVLHHFDTTYHWSIMQVEYSTDIVFRRQDQLRPLYETLVRTAIHSVKPDHVATFLGRKLDPNYEGEVGTDFVTRLQGTCIRHHMGPVAIKVYDKHSLVLRIETVANDVSFFKHYRKVEHRDGTSETKYAAMQKTIYSIPPLREILLGANRRYIEFISALDDPSSGLRDVQKISHSVRSNNRAYRGFNLFDSDDLDLFVAIARGEFNITGFTNRLLRSLVDGLSASRVSRLLKRLRLHGLIRRMGATYRYRLTALGKRTVCAALVLRETLVIPALASIPYRDRFAQDSRM